MTKKRTFETESTGISLKILQIFSTQTFIISPIWSPFKHLGSKIDVVNLPLLLGSEMTWQGTWISIPFHCDVHIETPGKTWRVSQSFSDTLIVEVDNNQKLENQFASSTNAGGISSVQRPTLRSCSTGPVLIEGMEHHLATSTKWALDPVIHGLMGPRIHG